MIRSLTRPLALVLTGITAVACDSDRAIVTEPLAAAYNFRFATVGSNIPRGSVTHRNATTATNDSILIRLAGLEQLSGGVYQVFLGTQATATAEPTNWTPATGRLRIIETDTTIVNDDPVPDPDTTTRLAVSSFPEGGPRTRFELDVDVGTNPNGFNIVLVTIEPAAATSPGADSPRPLWGRLFGATGNVRSATLAFGNYNADPAAEYRYGIGGRGTLSAWNNILIVDDSALALPPKGYYYATVVTRDIPAAGNTFTRDTIDLGPQKAPYPRRNVSLRDADINPNLDPVVLEFPPSILAASERVRVDTIGAVADPSQPFRYYQNVWVTLETKAGIADASPSVILTSTFPENVARPPVD